MPFAFAHDHIGITLRSEDLEATVEWYTRNLDLELAKQFQLGGITFTYLGGPDVEIELMSGGASQTADPVGSDIFATLDPERLHHFCLAVEDLDATLTELASRGVRPMGDPMEIAPIGQRVAFITDNLGTIIELAEPGTGWRALREN